jgi:hypothetical protein
MENLNDLIYAYSLGCLNPEEHQKFLEHLDSGEELNIQALGEYQNLVSLLPTILTIENPDPQLKDNVAKKLYRLKDEIRAQRQKNKPSLNNHESKEEKKQDSSIKEPEILTSENTVFKSPSPEEYDFQNIVGETIDLSSNKKISPTRPIVPIQKNYRTVIWGAVLFSLLVIGIIVTYLNISLKTNNLNNEIENLKKEVGNLNIQLIGSQEIQEMLQSPDVQVVNLKGTSFNPQSFGKLIIDTEKGVGYIKLAQMPSIPEDKLFQLWVNISGNYISLKSFQSADTMGFYSFKMLTLPKGEGINFRITEEPVSGVTTPGNKVYLQGILNP